MMLRFAFRRFYFAAVGLLLLTLPLFAASRIGYTRAYPLCSSPAGAVALRLRCAGNDAVLPALPRDGAFYAVWQRGYPPYDYWPLALALVAAVAAFEAIAIFRARRRVA